MKNIFKMAKNGFFHLIYKYSKNYIRKNGNVKDDIKKK